MYIFTYNRGDILTYNSNNTSHSSPTYLLNSIESLQNRWTPIHVAAGEGRTDMVALLIRHGADPKVLDVVRTWSCGMLDLTDLFELVRFESNTNGQQASQSVSRSIQPLALQSHRFGLC